MNIIAFDTSSDILCAALLLSAGGKVSKRRILETSIDDGLRHAELLTETIDSLCNQAALERSTIQGVVCGRGPGSFTGLRIGMATAKGMATALACPLSSVSAFDAIAFRHSQWPGLVLPLMDARKNRFYTGLYYQGERVGEYADLAAGDIEAWISQNWLDEFSHSPILLTGPDAHLLAERLRNLGSVSGQQFKYQTVLDPAHRKGWGAELAEIGWRRIQSGNWDTPDMGPEYVRSSDAELGISLKAP